LGRPIGHRATLGRVGYLPEHARFPEYLTGEQVVMFSAALAHTPRASAKKRTGELLERVGLGVRGRDKVGSYSKGMKQRLGLAQSLVCDPDLVILDEPTDGVDPEGRIDIRKLIEEMRGDGKSVFLNSHLLAEVEQVADHVAILSKGRVIEHGAVAELTRRGRRYEIRSEGPVPFAVREPLVAEGKEVAGDMISFAAESAADAQPVIDRLRQAGVVIREVREARLSLENLFLAAVKGDEKKGGVL